MTNPRKHAQYRARIERASRSVLATNKVCIVNLNEPYFFQTTFHHGNRKMIKAGARIAQALCDIPHRWTIYMAVFLDTGNGQKYTRAIEVETTGIYKAEHLTDVIREHHTDLVAKQNPNHVKSSGWIAFPYPIQFHEEDADALFESAIEMSRAYENEKKPEAFTI